MILEKRILAIDNLRVLIALFVAIFHVVFFLYLFHSAQLGFIAYSFEQVFFSKMPIGIYSIAFFSLTYVPFFMNSFYLLSGFFANAVCREKGVLHFTKSRFVKIGIPFLFYFACVAIYYLFVYLLPIVVSQKKSLLAVISDQYHQGVLWNYFNNTSTYWFLDLMLFYTFFVCIFIAIRQLKILPQKFFIVTGSVIHALFLSKGTYLFLPLYIMTLLLCGHHWYLVLDDHIIPGWHILLFYGIWYVVGWNIYNDQSVWLKIQKHAIEIVILSIGLYFAHAFMYIHFVHQYCYSAYFFSCALFSLSLTTSVFGFVGFFFRYCAIERRYLKYLSDGSYWMYLIQIPIIYIVSAACIGYLKSFFLQFIVCSSVFAIIYLVTFHFLVRRTWLKKVVE